MTDKETQQNQLPPQVDKISAPPRDMRNLDVWARSTPIHLAGYGDDPSEPHILRSLD
ncbi:hypothetical protein [Streptomyces sp. NPDC052107]|uniref:hypothetical protein n=1 Tax=Streptomyces sp. NPDC052107 TaxID=3155632 RepID=UPI00344636BD